MSDLLSTKKGKPNADEKAFAIDLLSYIDALRSQDKELIEKFTPPSSNIGNITDLNKTVDQFKGSELLQGGGKDPLFESKTLKADEIAPIRKPLEEVNQDSDIETFSDEVGQSASNIINSNFGSGNGSGLTVFVPTSHRDGLNINAAFNYGIPIG